MDKRALKTLISEFIGLDLSDDACNKLQIYSENILKWNSSVNLISQRSESDIYERHILDSLYVINALKDIFKSLHINIVDLGSGAGFPAIPLKIVCPEVNITLIESITKKCSFLKDSSDLLGLKNIYIINKRAEDALKENDAFESFDACTLRALSSVPSNLELSAPYLKIGGFCFMHKTKKDVVDIELSNKAMDTLGFEFYKEYPYKLSDHDVNFNIMVFRKTAKPKGIFPRRPGIAQKKPL